MFAGNLEEQVDEPAGPLPPPNEPPAVPPAVESSGPAEPSLQPAGPPAVESSLAEPSAEPQPRVMDSYERATSQDGIKALEDEIAANPLGDEVYPASCEPEYANTSLPFLEYTRVPQIMYDEIVADSQLPPELSPEARQWREERDREAAAELAEAAQKNGVATPIMVSDSESAAPTPRNLMQDLQNADVSVGEPAPTEVCEGGTLADKLGLHPNEPTKVKQDSADAPGSCLDMPDQNTGPSNLFFLCSWCLSNNSCFSCVATVIESQLMPQALLHLLLWMRATPWRRKGWRCSRPRCARSLDHKVLLWTR